MASDLPLPRNPAARQDIEHIAIAIKSKVIGATYTRCCFTHTIHRVSGSDAGPTIAAAFIGVGGSIAAALITVRLSPRQAQPVTAPAPAPAEPVNVVQPDGSYRLVSPPAPPAPVPAAKPKVSRALWWSIAAIVSVELFTLSWACALVGIFLAVRDTRSPGTRRLAWWALGICAVAVIAAAANPHSGFMQGFRQGYDSTRG
jgi:hypothetical protein